METVDLSPVTSLIMIPSMSKHAFALMIVLQFSVCLSLIFILGGVKIIAWYETNILNWRCFLIVIPSHWNWTMDLSYPYCYALLSVPSINFIISCANHSLFLWGKTIFYTFCLSKALDCHVNCFHVQLLGRTIDLRSLISERMNKVFRDNLEFLFDRFESQDLCAIVVSLSSHI